MSIEELLYAALEQPLGLVVESDEQDRLLRKLYNVRKSQAIYGQLSFIRKTPTELWIIRSKPDG